MGRLSASGEDVGLPEGQMGNSEVGHLNLGAGRIVYQDLTRISKAIAEGKLGEIPSLKEFLAGLVSSGGKLHLMGLLSDGGVHSHQEHLHALISAAHKAGVKEICIHVITDGRDTSPTGGKEYLAALEAFLAKEGAGKIVTLIGRYFAMDRDNRWERTQKAYDLFMRGQGEKKADPSSAIAACYAAGTTDEFLPAITFVEAGKPIICDGDGILFYNFRSDRGRQIVRAIIDDAFNGFERGVRPKIQMATMTVYDETFGLPVLFTPQTMTSLLGETVAAAGLAQLRVAETEKYPHVTYFFNGGNEVPNPLEERLMVASPKVATYDLQPEMSAPSVIRSLLERIDEDKFDMIILNFANPDMVGHTGVLEAAIKAVETIDDGVRQITEKILSLGGKLLITADHGNCERMKNPDGSPHTAHTTNLVHVIYAAADAAGYKVRDGRLADVAPTLLDMLGVGKPSEMTGASLLVKA